MKKENINAIFFNKLYIFSISNLSLIFLAIWSFFEASIWFIIPDFILFYFIILNPKNQKKFFITVFVTSSIGVIAYYFFVLLHREFAFKIIEYMPFTNHAMIQKIIEVYLDKGIIATLFQAFMGIPSKIWTYSSVVLKIGFYPYISLVLISRGLRMYITSIVGYFIGKKYNKKIKQNCIFLTISYIIILFITLSKIS